MSLVSPREASGILFGTSVGYMFLRSLDYVFGGDRQDYFDVLLYGVLVIFMFVLFLSSHKHREWT